MEGNTRAYFPPPWTITSQEYDKVTTACTAWVQRRTAFVFLHSPPPHILLFVKAVQYNTNLGFPLALLKLFQIWSQETVPLNIAGYCTLTTSSRSFSSLGESKRNSVLPKNMGIKLETSSKTLVRGLTDPQIFLPIIPTQEKQTHICISF